MADIVRRRPGTLSRRLAWPFTRFFEDFFEDWGDEYGLPGRLPGRGAEFVPAIDVSETADAIEITAEVPGMSKEDLDVSVEDGVLSLRGEKKEESSEEEAGWHRTERRYGRFERHVRLPQYADPEHVEASYKEGVLHLHVPKTEKARPKAIEIK